MYYYYGYSGLSTGAYIGIAAASLATAIVVGSLVVYYRRRQARLAREALEAQYNQPMQNPDFFPPGFKPNMTQVNNETMNYTNNTGVFTYVPPEQPSAPPPTYDASRNDVRVNQAHQAV